MRSELISAKNVLRAGVVVGSLWFGAKSLPSFNADEPTVRIQRIAGVNQPGSLNISTVLDHTPGKEIPSSILVQQGVVAIDLARAKFRENPRVLPGDENVGNTRNIISLNGKNVEAKRSSIVYVHNPEIAIGPNPSRKPDETSPYIKFEAVVRELGRTKTVTYYVNMSAYTSADKVVQYDPNNIAHAELSNGKYYINGEEIDGKPGEVSFFKNQTQ